jgi:hypothetical protein
MIAHKLTIYAVQEFFIGGWSDISGQHQSENKALMESKFQHEAAISQRPVRLIERIETVLNESNLAAQMNRK